MPVDYTALKTAWASTTLPSGVTGTPLTASMTPAQKLSALQAWMVAGASNPVPATQVVGYLALNGKLTGLQSYAANPPSGAVAEAVLAAKEFVTCIGLAGFVFGMNVSSVYSQVQAFLDALASDTNTGITATDVTNIMALAASPTEPWYSASVSAGGAGLPGQLTAMDLTAAGLATAQQFPGA